MSGVLGAEPLDRDIEIEEQRAPPIVANHRLDPEKGAETGAACDRCDVVQAGCRVQNHMTGRKLHGLGPVHILDHELTALYGEDGLDTSRAFDRREGGVDHALQNGRVDAVMSDVPIVVDAATKYPDLVVAGQFKTDEQYGAVLAKGAPNTRVLSEVIDQLRTDGVLDRLFQKYFPEQVDIPSLG